VVIEQMFDPSHIALERYENEWLQHNGGELGKFDTYVRPGGWPEVTPYMDHPALLALACNGALADLLEELIGEPMGVHLCLTGWQSTRRDWHRDQYLNEPYVGGFYAAVWLGLDDIDPDSGPFQYVIGSHTGNPISQRKIRRALGINGYGPDWPKHSERILTPLFKEQLDSARVTTHLSTRGEVLVWHGRLLHRGSVPINPALERRALIMHFSGINHRPDMPPANRHANGGWYFPL
jgi:ectoine hydroxylase-related dioxygenase (phytanoyl-CoA dioxygenase family)